MTKLLIRLFIKDPGNTGDQQVREAYGILAGFVGIVCNILLCAAKFVIGIISGSIAIQADAVNNLSDVGSSVVTLIGARLAASPADSKHPFGHARFEYIASLIIAFIILVVGFELGKESIYKIMAPKPVDFSAALMIVLILSILLKFWMSRFTFRVGRLISSSTMSAATADSICDVISTGAILVSAVLGYFYRINLDGYMGVIVACFVLYSGIKILLGTINPLLGEAPDPEMSRQLVDKMLSYDGIIGVHDVLIHSYGPGKTIASAHAEVRGDGDIMALHDVIDSAERTIGREMNLLLTIHLDPIEMDNAVLDAAHSDVTAILHTVDDRLKFHDFRMVTGPTHTNLVFDIVVPPGTSTAASDALISRIEAAVREKHPNYNCIISVDTDYVGRE